MLPTIWVGTEKGLHRLGDQADEGVVPDRRIVDVTTIDHGGWLALVEGAGLYGHDGLRVELPGPEATCLLRHDGTLLVGTREAHLLRAAGDPPAFEPVTSFEQAEGRETWYTPWGGPPDTRSLSRAADGALYVNVHVGGILRSDDEGASWRPTIDVDADVHQVLAGAGPLLAATAYGLARSEDRGRNWTFETEGLHAEYSRAVAVAGDWLLLSASTGPRGERAAVYRRPLDAAGAPFERCRQGLPEWFAANIDTGCLVAQGETVALGSAQGQVFVSEDAGATWQLAADGLPRVTRLALGPPTG
jgi:hypothetical protein